jgi:hypothetical protein
LTKTTFFSLAIQKKRKFIHHIAISSTNETC